MRRTRIHFSSLFKVKHGYAFKGQYFDNSGPYVLLTPGNFHEEGGFKDQGDKQKYYSGDFPEEFILTQGDLIVVMTEQAEGLLGSPALIPESKKYLHNQRLGLVTELDEARLDKKYLFFLFNTRSVRHQISASATGTKVRHTAPERIGMVEIELPPLRIQRKISSILSAYDDLIENNERRMALIEESARLLYQEWFVRLRFPGHRHTRIIDGVPEGWDQTPFENALFLQRGFDLPVQSRKNGSIAVYGSTGISGYHNAAKVSGPGIITGRSGTLGDVQYVREDFWPLNTTLWVKDFKLLPPLYALFLLRGMDLSQYNGGVSVPTLDRKTVHKIEILIPPRRLIAAFEGLVSPIFEQVANLTNQNQKLRTARDLLLPKLMSGEIAV